MSDATGAVVDAGELANAAADTSSRSQELCADAPGSQEELLSTPRDNRGLEQLARSLDDSFVASDATYQRLVSDIEAFRTIEPKIRNAEIADTRSPGFLLTANQPAFEHIRAGGDPYFECLRRRYPGSVSFQYLSALEMGMVVIDFNGVYGLNQLLPAYTRVQGARADINRVITLQPLKETVRVMRAGTRWAYTFPTYGARCGSVDSCQERTLYELASESDGTREPIRASDTECVCQAT